MKKTVGCAILVLCLTGCYTPLNNSGVATNKPWLEISGTKTDFDGKQYDSCYRFNVRFWPQEATSQLDLVRSCITACCWRSEQEEVTLDLNRHFETDLAVYGRARKYTPGKITFKVTHANWLNTSRVSVSPARAVSNDGLIKLSYTEHENPARLAQLARQASQRAAAPAVRPAQTELPHKPAKTSAKIHKTLPPQEELAKALFQRQAGPKVDTFFYQMDKTYKKQGAVFLLSDRWVQTRTNADGTYELTCQAKARTGLDVKNLNASTFSCGKWQADLAHNLLTPQDKRARLIWDE